MNEAAEDNGHFFFSDSNSGIGNRNGNILFAISCVSGSEVNPNLSCIRKLDCIADQVQRDLPDAAAVANKGVAGSGFLMQNKTDALFCRLDRHDADNLVKQYGHAERSMCEGNNPGFDFTDFQQAIHNCQKSFGAIAQNSHTLLLPVVQFRAQQNIGKADDRAHRGSDFMTRIHEKIRFRLIGLFRFVPCGFRQRLFGADFLNGARGAEQSVCFYNFAFRSAANPAERGALEAGGRFPRSCRGGGGVLQILLS